MSWALSIANEGTGTSAATAAGRLSAHKVYLFYYGGRSTYSCGGAAWR